ncbi:hypothetical protein IMSAGC017_00448 [Thomasclavelia cocleata]|uniref:Uncharacterized protein n=1 Tax=Thomasclavelia cocleata TaxID=69824 RepID=A0A829Z8E7_9FIRM|nr:DUF6625 family protein [Thomasclavelia cocleata]GFI40416.1 hypothetical protein IMSAGC017_00448 [Thomasclavelia cocleata]
MLKKALIIPYFGKFNNYFKLWLKSCEYNDDFDWLIFTDDRSKYSYPENVHVYYISFEKIKEKINNLFEFEISLDSPYKLCDFRPAYGEIFEDYLKEYDYWGYCDTDLIWGHLSDFYNEDILKEYDKISDAGHFTLYKNNDAMKFAYKNLNVKGCYDYKTVFTSSKSFAYDEWGNNKGINRILLENEYKIYYKPIWFSDICIDTYGLKNTRAYFDLKERTIEEKNKEHIVFFYNEGRLFQYYLEKKGKLCFNQEAYVHLQKRPMINESIDYDRFMIVPPNKFINYNKEISADYLLSINENKIYWHYYKIRFNNFKRKLKRLGKRK